MRNMPAVLVVEDEPAIAELVAVNLRQTVFEQPGPWTVPAPSAKSMLECPT